MHFTKTLTTFLVSAALTNFASAYAVDSSLVARVGIPFSKITANKATIDKSIQYCKKGRSKRDLDSRAPWPPSVPGGFTAVTMGTHKGEKDPLGLWTYGLVTCIGVGVTGTPKDSKSDSRFLMHFMATHSSVDSQLKPFADAIKSAGLTNMEGWLSLPDSTNKTPSDWTKDDKELADEMAEGITDALKYITGKDPKIVTRPMGPAVAHEAPHGFMQIDNKNNVDIEGDRVHQ